MMSIGQLHRAQCKLSVPPLRGCLTLPHSCWRYGPHTGHTVLTLDLHHPCSLRLRLVLWLVSVPMQTPTLLMLSPEGSRYGLSLILVIRSCHITNRGTKVDGAGAGGKAGSGTAAL